MLQERAACSINQPFAGRKKMRPNPVFHDDASHDVRKKPFHKHISSLSPLSLPPPSEERHFSSFGSIALVASQEQTATGCHRGSETERAIGQPSVRCGQLLGVGRTKIRSLITLAAGKSRGVKQGVHRGTGGKGEEWRCLAAVFGRLVCRCLGLRLDAPLSFGCTIPSFKIGLLRVLKPARTSPRSE